MDDSDHDPMEDLEAFLDEQRNIDSVAAVPALAAAPAVASAPAVPVGGSIFAHAEAAPETKHLLLGKNFQIMETSKTSHTNTNPDQEAFRTCVQFLEKDNNPTTLKST